MIESEELFGPFHWQLSVQPLSGSCQFYKSLVRAGHVNPLNHRDQGKQSYCGTAWMLMPIWFLRKWTLNWRLPGGRLLSGSRSTGGNRKRQSWREKLDYNSAQQKLPLNSWIALKLRVVPSGNKRAESSPHLHQPIISGGLPLRRRCDLGLGSSLWGRATPRGSWELRAVCSQQSQELMR